MNVYTYITYIWTNLDVEVNALGICRIWSYMYAYTDIYFLIPWIHIPINPRASYTQELPIIQTAIFACMCMYICACMCVIFSAEVGE